MRRIFLLAALSAALISSAVLIGTGSSQALASTGGAARYCPQNGVVAAPPYRPPTTKVRYLSGNYLLGPKYLPQRGTIGRILAGYNRFDGTGSAAFLSCFWDPTPYMNWVYPKDNGFLIFRGKPVEHTRTLHRGQEIDLFGNPGNPKDPSANKGGHFLSPADTPYKKRALPPTNLDTYSRSAPFNYHRYKVLKDFSVVAGPIAPWFYQPGGGIQDYLGDNRGIANLVHDHYVRELHVPH